MCIHAFQRYTRHSYLLAIIKNLVFKIHAHFILLSYIKDRGWGNKHGSSTRWSYVKSFIFFLPFFCLLLCLWQWLKKHQWITMMIIIMKRTFFVKIYTRQNTSFYERSVQVHRCVCTHLKLGVRWFLFPLWCNFIIFFGFLLFSFC